MFTYIVYTVTVYKILEHLEISFTRPTHIFL